MVSTGNWHINPDTREVGPCKAKVKCNFGEDAPHFAERVDAFKENERLLAEYEIPEALKKNVEKEIRSGELSRESYIALKQEYRQFAREERDAGELVNSKIKDRDDFLISCEENGFSSSEDSVKERVLALDAEIADAYEDLDRANKAKIEFLNAHQMAMVEYQKRVDPESRFSNRLGV